MRDPGTGRRTTRRGRGLVGSAWRGAVGRVGHDAVARRPGPWRGDPRAAHAGRGGHRTPPPGRPRLAPPRGTAPPAPGRRHGGPASRVRPVAPAARRDRRRLRAGPRAHRCGVGALPGRDRGHHHHRRHRRWRGRRAAGHPAGRGRQPDRHQGQPAAAGGAGAAAHRRRQPARPELRHDHPAACPGGRRRGRRLLDPARRLRRHPRLPHRQDQCCVPGGAGADGRAAGR